MKIIEVMGSRSTKYGGVETFIYNMVLASPETEFHIIYNELPWSKKYLMDLERAGAYVHVIDVRNAGYLKNYFKFRALIKKIKPDVVHFHFSAAHCFWAPLCRMMGVKKIIKTVHCCLYNRGCQARSLSDLSVKHRISTRWGKLYQIYDEILCVSHFVKNQFIQVYGDNKNIEVVYMGTDTPRELYEQERQEFKNYLRVKSSEKIILSIMFASPEKGCDILINALPFIEGCYKVLLIGLDDNSNYTQEMRQLAKELAVDDRIIWVGITNDIYKYMSIADIFVQPSRTDALPLAAVEAMSHKLPVVATRTGGLPELASALFEYEDSKGLASCINMLLTNSEEYYRQSAKSYEAWCDHFLLKRGIDRYLQFYSVK